MMKRIIAVLAVVAMMGVSSIAFAASDISVSGKIDIRSRDFQNLTLDKNDAGTGAQQVDTNQKIQLNVDVKADDVTGKISIENDWDNWSRNESYQANGATASPDSGDVFLKVREAWIGFKIPDTPIGVKAGHQLLALSNGWFYRAMKYGADAWVVYTDIDKLHLGFVDVKAYEGGSSVNHDDTDAYVLVANLKLSDDMTAGINITDLKARGMGANPDFVANSSAAFGVDTTGFFEDLNLWNIGPFFNAKLGIVDLKAELDIQNGKLKAAEGGDDLKFGGNQIIIEAKAALDPVTINATLARGTGMKQDADNKVDQVITLLDADKHYTFLFEYKIPTRAADSTFNFDGKHTGFANVTALNVGVSAKVGNSLTVGAQAWMLQATEKLNYAGAAADETTKDLGTELDANINWQITKSLSWNWDLGYFSPGKAYNKADGSKGDTATGIQGVLSFKF